MLNVMNEEKIIVYRYYTIILQNTVGQTFVNQRPNPVIMDIKNFYYYSRSEFVKVHYRALKINLYL